jgi:hypothetical protein
MRRPRLLFGILALVMGAGLLLWPQGVVAQDLDRTLDRIAAAWHKGDASAVAGLAARSGISLNVDGRAVGPLAPRQAAAVIRRVFEDRESLSVRSNMTRGAGGSPARAFGEITWTTRARGTTIPGRDTIFVAFVHEDDQWRITEIRLIR